MKRRAKGSGCIIKQANGYYCGRIVRNGKAQVVRLSKNLREANTLWAEWLGKHQEAPKGDAAKHTLDEAWTALESVYRAKGTEKLVVAYYRRHFVQFRDWLAAHGKQYLEEVNSDDIVNALAETTEGQSVCLKRNYKYMVRGLFDTVLPDIPNPCRKIKIQWQPQICREPFTDEELAKIIEEAKKHENGEEFAALIKVGLFTGLRLKDCIHIKQSNIKDDVLEVMPFKTAKKGIIVRIPLHAELKECLNALEADNEGRFFPNLLALHAKGLINGRLKRIFNKVVETSATQANRKRKIPVKTFHSLRATFLTRLAQKGVSVAIMESLGGHTNKKQLMHYVHPDDETKKAAIDALGFSGSEDDKVFMLPEVKKTIEVCKQMIAESIEKALGERAVEMKSPPKKSPAEYGEIIGVGLVKDYLEARRKGATA